MGLTGVSATASVGQAYPVYYKDIDITGTTSYTNVAVTGTTSYTDVAVTGTTSYTDVTIS